MDEAGLVTFLLQAGREDRDTEMHIAGVFFNIPLLEPLGIEIIEICVNESYFHILVLLETASYVSGSNGISFTIKRTFVHYFPLSNTHPPVDINDLSCYVGRPI